MGYITIYSVTNMHPKLANKNLHPTGTDPVKQLLHIGT